MKEYSRAELAEALRALDSTLAKCEKALPKLKPGSSQSTLLIRRIAALEIAIDLLGRELENLRAIFR